MKLTKKMLTGLAVTTSVAGVVTPLVTLTSCSCGSSSSKEEGFVTDVTEGYTPSDDYKSTSKKQVSLSDSMKDWFNFAYMNQNLPLEEYKWSCGERAKDIANLNFEKAGAIITGNVNKATAGMEYFEINDFAQRRVSYHIAGYLDFDIIGDFTKSEDLDGIYTINFKFEYDIVANNIKLSYDDGTKLLAEIYKLVARSDMGEYVVAYLPYIGQFISGQSNLGIFPDVTTLTNDKNWSMMINTKGDLVGTKDGYEFANDSLEVHRLVDLEFMQYILSLRGGSLANLLPVLASLGSAIGWKSYYQSEVPLNKFTERVPLDEDDDISQPAHIINDVAETETRGFLVKYAFTDSINYWMNWADQSVGLPFSTGFFNFNLTGVSCEHEEDKPLYITLIFGNFQWLGEAHERIVLEYEVLDSFYMPFVNVETGQMHAYEIAFTNAAE